MQLHHLGIACAGIDETLCLVNDMFPVISRSEVIHDPEQNADLCLVSLRHSPPLELIAGPMVCRIAKKGIALYHSCWEVDDMELAIANLCKTANCLVVSDPKPAVLFDMRPVAFLSSPVGLVELLAAR